MTTTTIDAMVLEFGLDHRPFTRDQKEVLDELRRFEEEGEKVANRAESKGRRVTDVMSSFRREALTALGVFLGGRGVKEFVGHMTELDASTGKAALTLNMSTRELSAWEGAIEQSGGKAGSMRGTLQGLTQDMNRFMLTGQGTLAGLLRPLGISLFDDNKNLKDAGTLILEIVKATEKMDPARRSALLGMMPGMNEDSINLMMRSRRELEAMVEKSRELGGTTAESARQAQEYQKATANLDRSMTSLGRTLMILVGPALTATANALQRMFAVANTSPDSPEGKAISAGNRATSIRKFGSPGDLLRRLGSAGKDGDWLDRKISSWLYQKADEWYGPEGQDEKETFAAEAAAKAALAKDKATGGKPSRSVAETSDYIRKAAIARGIDPEVALKNAAGEGLYKYVGDDGSSFGAFQLHYGGMSPKYPSKGLGDEFTRKTGKHASDESTWKEQIDFYLDHVVGSGRGWADIYGRKSGVFDGLPGRGGGNRTSTTTIGTVNVYTQATDAKGIAEDIKPQLERGAVASQFNGGLE